jgi:hypothetical protein
MAIDKILNGCSIYLNHPEPRISCIPRNTGIKNAQER